MIGFSAFRRGLFAGCAFTLFATTGAFAQVLLLDVTNTGGTTTFGANVAPYATSASDIWNRGGTSNWGTTLRYADNTLDTNLRVVVDGLSNGSVGTALYNFTSPGVTGTANTGPGGVFGNFPVKDAVYHVAATNVGYGGHSMRVSGLAAGTYEVYVVAAYVGVNEPTWPGSGSAAQFNTWALAGPNADTLLSGSFGAPMELLENSTSASWVEGNTYAKMTVTLDALNPTLFIVAENAANDSRRGWLNAVQIVAVPEPGAAGLLAASLGGFLLLARRRRKG